jgi:endonuclease/exonuclease/phosphatase family metal-dependent hydrolase
VADFRFLTWNSFGAAQDLLSFIRWRGVLDPHRFDHPTVRATVAGVDVLCMQEIYLSEAERFFDALEHGHKVRDPNDTVLRPLSFGGSGLGVASRLPVSAHRGRAFSPPHASIERFARKGMLHARVRFGERDVDVVTTHMQSGRSRRARAIRKRQLAELRRFVDDVGRSGVPVILAGDLNIDGLERGGRTEYADLARALPDFVDVGPADRPTWDPHENPLARRHAPREPPQRLDYAMVADPGGALEVVGVERVLRGALDCDDGASTFASDHCAIELRVRVR